MTTRTRPASAPCRPDDDRGTSLIELLVSIVLLGTAGIAVLTALSATIRGSDVHQDVADTQSWLATAGDVLIDVPPEAQDTYRDCVTHTKAEIITGYQDVVDAIPASPDVIVADVEFWDASIAGNEGFGPTCRSAAGDRLQRVTLRSTVDTTSRTLQVVKRPALDQTVNTLAPPTTLGGGNLVAPLTPGLDP